MDFYSFIYSLPVLLAECLISYEIFKERNVKKYIDYERKKEKEYFTSKAQFMNDLLSYQLKDYIPKPTTIHSCSSSTAEKIKEEIRRLNNNQELESLLDKILDYIPVEYLGNLIRNIKTLEILHEKPINNSIIFRSLGCYYCNKNIIYLPPLGIINTLSHEFLHAASSFYKDDLSISGFSIGNKYGKYFSGLNEGYTEVLNSRIFGFENNGYTSCYKICLLIELLFDNYHDMEQAYFCNNTDLLIETFLKYGTKDEFVYIIEYLDVFATTIPEVEEMEAVISLLKDIISRTNNPDKIIRCEELTREEPKKDMISFVKKLVKKK